MRVELVGVVVEILLGEPGREPLRIDHAREEACRLRQVEVPGLLGWHRAGGGVEHHAQHAARVGIELALGLPGLLEIEDVEEALAGHGLHQLRGRHGRAWNEGHRHADHAAEAIGPQQRGAPRHDGSPVVADDHGGLGAEGIEQARHVAHQVEDGVGVDGFGGLGLAVATHVGRHGVVARRSQRRELMPPRVPELGEAVTQEHQRAFAGLRHVHLDAVGLDGAVTDPGHLRSPRCGFGSRWGNTIRGVSGWRR